MTDAKRRTIAKTITFRVIATIATVVLVLLFTGDLAIAGAIGALEVISKLVIYYFHERVWEHVAWGKQPVRD